MMKTRFGVKPMPEMAWPPATPLPAYVPTTIFPETALNAIQWYVTALELTEACDPTVNPPLLATSIDWIMLACSAVAPVAGFDASPTMVEERNAPICTV